ncbi:MAG: hypothetical protein WC641_03570 [Patescibacteria group bacterium]
MARTDSVARDEYVFPPMYLIAWLLEPVCRLLDRLIDRTSQS